MRAALLQAMARDPNGRFDTALAFANALRNSVSTLGGPASASDLARLLFTDFGDEMSSRDEILKAADEPGPMLPGPALAEPKTSKTPTPPPIPQRALRPTPPPPLPIGETSGELGHRERPRSDLFPAIPSMIVQQGSAPVVVVPTLPTGVLDLSATVPADTWMANPETDLLGAHRRKTLRTMLIAIAGLAVICGLLFALFQISGPEEKRPIDAVPDAALPDARPIDAPKPVDADDRANITALSRYGFFSLAATAKTNVYINDKLYGETPLTRLPLTPGVYRVKAVGPRNKVKTFKISIYGGKDTDEGTINW
jgi:hypothetical protein